MTADADPVMDQVQAAAADTTRIAREVAALLGLDVHATPPGGPMGTVLARWYTLEAQGDLAQAVPTWAWAAHNGLDEIYTWTQAGNSAMLRLNEHLGYITTRNSITVSGALPLTTSGQP